MADRAEMLGRTDLYIVGEWSNGGIDDEQSLASANSYDVYRTNIFDFDFSLSSRSTYIIWSVHYFIPPAYVWLGPEAVIKGDIAED